MYCQPAMFEHARRRFLRDAAAMVNLDIDELVVSEDGVSLFDHLAASASGAIVYAGAWIRNRRTGSLWGTRHRYFRHRLAGDDAYLQKWSVIPARIPERAQLANHDIRDYAPDRVPQIVFRHFRAISRNWKYQRSGFEWRHRRRKRVVDVVWVQRMQEIGWA
jgi:hypothetical protein